MKDLQAIRVGNAQFRLKISTRYADIKSMRTSQPSRRRHTRYHIGITEPVFCQRERIGHLAEWQQVTAKNESFGGCSLLLNESDEVSVGEHIKINFANQYQLEAEVVRVVRISEHTQEVGCRFIE